jgi:hypothetical protein
MNAIITPNQQHSRSSFDQNLYTCMTTAWGFMTLTVINL